MRLGVLSTQTSADPLAPSCVVGSIDPNTGQTIANCPAPCVVGAVDPATGDTIAYCPPDSLLAGPNTSCPTGYVYDSVSFTCIPQSRVAAVLAASIPGSTWIPGVSNNMVLGIGAGIMALIMFTGGRRR
jgi:hypothetical protein